MKALLFVSASVAFCAAVSFPANAEGQVPGSRVYKLHAQNGSHEYGTVALKPHGTRTDVEIHLIGAPAGVAQPAHIHMGTCKTLDPTPKYPLQAVLDGTSDISVDAPIATLLASPMAINVHASASNLKEYVACADLKAS
ncbi:MAG: hypothetical protein NVSMB59_17380 [Vulcanimicrobiaceae bacterium]